MTLPSFTIAALSWASPATTARSLASWAPLYNSGACAERLIYFQERTELETALARQHSFEPLGDSQNVGIAPAYRKMLDRAQGSHFIFLECDWRLVHASRAARHARAALDLIESQEAAVVRLRSRTRPGWPVNPSQLQNKELTYPYWLLDSTFWEPHPERIFPNHLRRLEVGGEDWVLAPARYAGWTNNPHVARVDWLVEHVRPFTRESGKVFEGVIDAHWRELPVDVAQGRGLFTHSRIDGPGFYRQPLHRRIGYPIRMRLRRHLRRLGQNGGRV
jgi:hypothetical protein